MKYKDLSESAKEHVLEDRAKFIAESIYWYEAVIDEFIMGMEKKGYTIRPEDVEFAGFNEPPSASFSADVNIRKWIQFHYGKNKYKYILNGIKNEDIEDYAYIGRNTSYWAPPRNKMFIEFEYFRYEKYEAQIEKLRKDIIEDANESADELHSNLQKEYDYLTSEEALLDDIKANNLTFNKYGNILSYRT